MSNRPRAILAHLCPRHVCDSVSGRRVTDLLFCRIARWLSRPTYSAVGELIIITPRNYCVLPSTEYKPARPRTYVLRTCLSLPSYGLPTYISTCLPAFLPSCLPASLPPCLPASHPACALLRRTSRGVTGLLHSGIAHCGIHSCRPDKGSSEYTSTLNISSLSTLSLFHTRILVPVAAETVLSTALFSRS